MAKRPEAEKYTVQNADFALTADQLFAAKVPCRKYQFEADNKTRKKDANGDPVYTLYYVNITFKNAADMKMRAIEKVKHAIGQEIAKSPAKYVDGVTVDSSGRLPKSAEEQAAELIAAARAANTPDSKKQMRALLLQLANELK